jgi:outer membrane murein-binding lipoprotein Lpp
MAIFASLMVFFLLVTAVLTVLFVTKTGDYNEQKKTATQRQQTIDTLNADVERLKNDVKRVEGERDAAKRDLGGAQGQADELKRQKQVISNCLTLAAEAADAADAGNAALAQQKRNEARPVCEEAGRYLD